MSEKGNVCEIIGHDFSTYVGEMQDKRKHGSGRETYANGDVYEGSFENGFRHGHGVMTYNNGKKGCGLI